MSEADRNSGLILHECEGGSAVAKSLLDELRSAEIGLRGGLLGKRPGWRGRLFDFVWLIYSVFFLVQPIQEHSQRSWIALAIAFSIFLGLYVGPVF